MLDRQNQGPQCAACGSPMKLSAIEPSSTGQDLRTFTCPECKRVERHIIERTVTDAWQGPRSTNAVVHQVHAGARQSKSSKKRPQRRGCRAEAV
jgi:hypothetical protein